MFEKTNCMDTIEIKKVIENGFPDYFERKLNSTSKYQFITDCDTFCPLLVHVFNNN